MKALLFNAIVLFLLLGTCIAMYRQAGRLKPVGPNEMPFPAMAGPHKWVGQVALKIRMDGCMASIETLENIGVIKEVYWQDEKIHGAEHLQIARCGDYDGKPDFTILVPRASWFGNVLIERY